MTMANNVRVLKVERAGHYTSGRYSVSITKHQMMKIPSWVRKKVGFYVCDNPKHRYAYIEAADELQAMTRFQKLWAALVTLEEGD